MICMEAGDEKTVGIKGNERDPTTEGYGESERQ